MVNVPIMVQMYVNERVTAWGGSYKWMIRGRNYGDTSVSWKSHTALKCRGWAFYKWDYSYT